MSNNDRYLVARRATIVNSSINLLLACLKVILGIIGHSQALVADGIHSFSDLITDALVLFASKIGTQKPDKEHPYGHRRIETLATIIISLILISVAAGIAYDTLHHIITRTPTEKPAYIVIIIAIISIFANEFLYHYTLYESRKINSSLLFSNAWHNRSDALVSIIVLISVIGTMLGAPYLDAIGAFIIALLIFKMAIKMIWNSAKELIDTAVDETFTKEITAHILQTPGVDAIHELRTRSHGENIFLDVHIEVDPHISVSEAHYISEQVNISLIKKFSHVNDVVVHIDPENDKKFILSKDLPDRHKIEALLKKRWQTISAAQFITKIILHYLNGKLSIEIYLPLQLITSTPTAKQKLDADFQAAIADINYLHSLTLYYT